MMDLFTSRARVMLDNIVIEPMAEEFFPWRCLHSGPLSRDTIDLWPVGGQIPWERYRRRNVPLLVRLTRTYGACGIVALDGNRIVGHLRFYPKTVLGLTGTGNLCLQQDYPSGPADAFAEKKFPSPARIKDRTLSVHCLMTGCSQLKENPFQRKGIGTRMAIALIRWAKANGWERIEAGAFEDLPIIYETTGSAGRTFWEKLGFSMVDRHPHPDLRDRSPFVDALEEQAISAGILPERARDLIVMHLSLR